ncbi:MAG: YaiI/YqxD family protein [Legionella sp.]|nr:YaiI/YqxD family protein [Legionella sp.]
MQLWIDGDACPKVIKDLLFRAAIRTQTFLSIVSNHTLSVPPSPFIKKHQVGLGFDVADKYILAKMQQNDLVITADIPLADAVITAGGFALNPRGEMYCAQNVKQYLALRNFNESLRSCQLITGGPPKLSQKEIRDFANNLDKFIHRKK